MEDIYSKSIDLINYVQYSCKSSKQNRTQIIIMTNIYIL